MRQQRQKDATDTSSSSDHLSSSTTSNSCSNGDTNNDDHDMNHCDENLQPQQKRGQPQYPTASYNNHFENNNFNYDDDENNDDDTYNPISNDYPSRTDYSRDSLHHRRNEISYNNILHQIPTIHTGSHDDDRHTDYNTNSFYYNTYGNSNQSTVLQISSYITSIVLGISVWYQIKRWYRNTNANINHNTDPYYAEFVTTTTTTTKDDDLTYIPDDRFDGTLSNNDHDDNTDPNTSRNMQLSPTTTNSNINNNNNTKVALVNEYIATSIRNNMYPMIESIYDEIILLLNYIYMMYQITIEFVLRQRWYHKFLGLNYYYDINTSNNHNDNNQINNLQTRQQRMEYYYNDRTSSSSSNNNNIISSLPDLVEVADNDIYNTNNGDNNNNNNENRNQLNDNKSTEPSTTESYERQIKQSPITETIVTNECTNIVRTDDSNCISQPSTTSATITTKTCNNNNNNNTTTTTTIKKNIESDLNTKSDFHYFYYYNNYYYNNNNKDGGGCMKLPPAFLNDHDYPINWMVYHPILHVVSKVQADMYDKKIHTESE